MDWDEKKFPVDLDTESLVNEFRSVRKPQWERTMESAVKMASAESKPYQALLKR
jgi:hypothetical protein